MKGFPEVTKAERAEKAATKVMLDAAKRRDQRRADLDNAIEFHVNAGIDLDVACKAVDAARDFLKRVKQNYDA